MKKFQTRLVTIIALVLCLAILTTALTINHNFSRPTPVHAASTATTTISASPKYIQSTGGSIPSGCSALNYGNYLGCSITLTITTIPKTGTLNWVSYRTASLCLYLVCQPDYDTAVLPSQGSVNASNPTTKLGVTVIVSDYCYHGYENATFTFVVAGTSAVAKVKYYCDGQIA